ncbi:hypothetical protein OAE28_00490 [bacterium]|nr:hypothetical protein [bacterium]
MAAKAREALMMIRMLFVLASIINSDGQGQELLSLAPSLIAAGPAAMRSAGVDAE